MKKILLAGLTVCSMFFVQAQTSSILPVNEKTGKVTFMEVVDAKDMSASETFKVMQDFAKEQGFQVVSVEGTEGEYKWQIPVEYRNYDKSGFDKGIVEVTVHLMAKDNRYRYIFTDFVHQSKVCSGGDLAPVKPKCPRSKMSLAGWTEIKKATRRKVNKTIDQMKELIKETKNDPTKNDDW